MRSEDHHASTRSASASCAAKAVNILLARGGKANLYDKGHSVNNIAQPEEFTTSKGN